MIRRGEANHPLVLVKRGRLDVRVDKPNGMPVQVATVTAGEYIGEAALLDRSPATATIIAATEAEILLLAPGAFYEILGANSALWAELKDRAERILKDLENRKTTGLAAMDLLAALAAEKDAAGKAAKESGLSPKAFSVFWALKDDPALRTAAVDPLSLAKEVEKLLVRFPNARVNADEQRQLRAAHYRPLLGLGKEERTKIVDLAIEIIAQ